MATLPIAGTLRGTILRVGAVSIHGDIYFDLLIAPEPVAHAAPEQPAPPIGLRVPSHATPGGHVPDVGERVEVQFLMGQVTSVNLLGGPPR